LSKTLDAASAKTMIQRILDTVERLGNSVPANVSFSIASVLVLTVVIALINNRIIEPRLAAYRAEDATVAQPGRDKGQLSGDESCGLRYAGCLVS
jgi:p-aminobenzoyl-glutamate transporter AbgT